ncbi:hypothetical protein [Phormidium tenue]|uniref:Uncharacterized protein n=1 Tax=Phormidium tenue FACHB-1050 TaxID=2692857 RepID=A0ABR8CFT3_9CYAN|nr:hypothetical protein [Phormidium tenue FACHB-1050]
MTGFQKNDFGISSTFGIGNTKIGFLMRIASFTNQINLVTAITANRRHFPWFAISAKELLCFAR